MEADKTWYKGGYLRFVFQEITKESIKREKKMRFHCVQHYRFATQSG